MSGLVPQTRRGFTLVEIMVSLMIFVVVSGAMVSILMMSSELYRRGEFSRSANDETIAVLGAISDDISHLAPERADGWFYAGTPSRSGNTLIAFTTTGQHENGLGTRGQNARTLVGLWVEEKNNEQPRLRRITLDDTLDVLDFIGSLLTNNGINDRMVTNFDGLYVGGYDRDNNPVNINVSVTAASIPEETFWIGRQVMRALANNPNVVDLHFTGRYNWSSPTSNGKGGTEELDVIVPSSVLTEGCLHFSAWLALNELPNMQRPKDKSAATLGQPDWEQIDHNGSTRLGPWGKSINGSGGGAEVYDTRPKNWRPTTTTGLNPVRKPPFPSALRLSFVLTGGGRFAPTGYLQSDLANDFAAGSFRYTGLKGIPSLPGSMVRIGDEWIAYQSVQSGTIYYEGLDTNIGAGRGARRSSVSAHNRGETIQVGQSYSLVRSLPR